MNIRLIFRRISGRVIQNRPFIKYSLLNPFYSFSQQKKKKIFQQVEQQQTQGTDYTNWILTRSQSHNHDISHLKRKYLKDRYSIHKLTNINFLCALANHKTKYSLNTNEKIILLAQLNHVFNILGKEKRFYNEFRSLSHQIIQQIKDPHDLICFGTFLSTLSDLGSFQYNIWQQAIDSLLVRKSDEEYDEIFGIIHSLNEYKQFTLQISQYHETKGNVILQFIPVLYRNNLELLRQFIKYNIFNLKQCRIIFRCLNDNKIKQKYFWRSINDWFNLYVKEQISRKNFEQFFIVSQKAIQRVINDDGMIRPRPILEELVQVAYLIAQNLHNQQGLLNQKDKHPLKRFLQFVQDLVLYAIQNGSNLYASYLDHHQYKFQTQKSYNYTQNDQDYSLNQDMIATAQQRQRIKLMQKKYKTIFINPIQIKNESLIHLLVVMRKCCGYTDTGQIPIVKQTSNQETTKNQQYYFTRSQQLIDINVLKWLVMGLCKKEMNYTISELLQIINSNDFLSFAHVNLDQLIVEKLKCLKNTMVSLKDLKELMLFLPLNQFSALEEIFKNFLLKSHPSEIYELTRIIQMQSVSIGDQQYPAQFPRKQEKEKWLSHLIFYFLHLPEVVNMHSKYYSFQQNCYFLYYLLKNNIYWEKQLNDQNYNYLGEMEKLKQSVKIASYSRGFKLQMNSYFYKLLNYVDLVEFFEGGNA